MMKVYCDTGAYRTELKSLELEGKIRVFQFKYENKNKHISHMASPSAPSWEEVNYMWKDFDSLTWDDLGKTSNKWEEIEALLGPNSIRDAKHLDSAYMEGCRVFLTSDKDDIVSRRSEIAPLLGITVLHFREDWSEFLSLIAACGYHHYEVVSPNIKL